MKRLLLFILPLLVTLFISCKKNNEEEKEKTTKLVKMVEDYAKDENGEWEANCLHTFYYDNQNRLIKVDGNRYGRPTNYLYETNNVIITYVFEEINQKDTLQLDSNGYLICAYKHIYSYENGYLKEITFNHSSVEYSWLNENIVQITEGKTKTLHEYSNKEDLLNINVLAVGGGIFQKFKGLSSKNYVIKQTSISNDNDVSIATFDYKFDKDNYPTQIILSIDGVEDSKFTITYY
jgi:uncharacterized protein YxeA